MGGVGVGVVIFWELKKFGNIYIFVIIRFFIFICIIVIVVIRILMVLFFFCTKREVFFIGF